MNDKQNLDNFEFSPKLRVVLFRWRSHPEPTVDEVIGEVLS